MGHRVDLRILAPVHLVLVALALGACGSASPAPESSSTASQGKQGSPAAPPPKQSGNAGAVEKVVPTGAKPRIEDSLGQPPKKLVVIKLKEGTGGRVRRGERIGARFMDVNYKTKDVQDFWGYGQGGEPVPYAFVLGQGRVRKGWELALPGQRLGTRLELLLPSGLAYGEGPMRYVVELIEREKLTPGER